MRPNQRATTGTAGKPYVVAQDAFSSDLWRESTRRTFAHVTKKTHTGATPLLMAAEMAGVRVSAKQIPLSIF